LTRPASDYHSGMRYEYTVSCRDSITYFALAASVVLVLGLATYRLAFLVFPGIVVAWAGVCIALDRKWHGGVENGMIIWETFFRGRRRSITIAEIARIEVHHDEGSPFLIFKYRNGRQKRAPINIYKSGEHEQFITAVLDEDPSIDIEYVS
jgi:hypothetical protein